MDQSQLQEVTNIRTHTKARGKPARSLPALLSCILGLSMISTGSHAQGVTSAQAANFITMLEATGETARALQLQGTLQAGQSLSLSGTFSNSGWNSFIAGSGVSLNVAGASATLSNNTISVPFTGVGNVGETLTFRKRSIDRVLADRLSV